MSDKAQIGEGQLLQPCEISREAPRDLIVDCLHLRIAAGRTG